MLEKTSTAHEKYQYGISGNYFRGIWKRTIVKVITSKAVALGGFPPLSKEGKANVKVLPGYIVETENRKNKQKSSFQGRFTDSFFMHFSHKLKKIDASCGDISPEKILT